VTRQFSPASVRELFTHACYSHRLIKSLMHSAGELFCRAWDTCLGAEWRRWRAVLDERRCLLLLCFFLLLSLFPGLLLFVPTLYNLCIFSSSSSCSFVSSLFLASFQRWSNEDGDDTGSLWWFFFSSCFFLFPLCSASCVCSPPACFSLFCSVLFSLYWSTALLMLRSCAEGLPLNVATRLRCCEERK
jgi:hypothetical protein